MNGSLYFWMANKHPRLLSFLLYLQLCKIKVVKDPEPITSVNSFHGVPGDTNSAMGNPMSRQGAADTAGGGGSVHTHDFSNVMDKIQVLSQALRR